jgi:hypothetical protein
MLHNIGTNWRKWWTNKGFQEQFDYGIWVGWKETLHCWDIVVVCVWKGITTQVGAKLDYNRKIQLSRGLKRCNTLTWHKQEVLEGNANPHPPMENYSKWRKILWQNSPNKGRTWISPLSWHPMDFFNVLMLCHWLVSEEGFGIKL